jgi:hypothetical protein
MRSSAIRPVFGSVAPAQYRRLARLDRPAPVQPEQPEGSTSKAEACSDGGFSGIDKAVATEKLADFKMNHKDISEWMDYIHGQMLKTCTLTPWQLGERKEVIHRAPGFDWDW